MENHIQMFGHVCSRIGNRLLFVSQRYYNLAKPLRESPSERKLGTSHWHPVHNAGGLCTNFNEG